MKLTHFGPKAVELSGTEALGPLSNAMVMQPPAPMPRKSQTVSGQAPSFPPLLWPGVCGLFSKGSDLSWARPRAHG